MKNISCAFVVLVFTVLITSCSTSTWTKDDNYNPDTREIEKIEFSPYYQLKTQLVPGLELILVSHLHKETIPGAYTLKKDTRRLLPNDYMVANDVTLYLRNGSDKPVNLELLAVVLDQKKLPYSSRSVFLPAHSSQSYRLGQISVDFRQTSLNVKIEYVGSAHQEQEFDMLRVPVNDIKNMGKGIRKFIDML